MRYFLALIGLVFGDLLIKYSLNTADIDPITIIPLFLDFYLTKNTGIALSLFSSTDPTSQIILSITIFLALSYLTYLFITTTDKLQKISLTLIIAGGLGNFLERVFFGSVTDYLYLRIGTTPLFIFNFADLIITIGAGIMIFSWLFTNERR